MAFNSVLQMYLDWANSLLCEHGIVINELKEFQDGRIFSLLVEILTGTRLFPSSEGCDDDDDISSLDRVQTILDYLTGLGIKSKVSASGVLKGELKSILDVIWAIILHFTIHSPDTPMQQKTVRSGKKQLIQWCASQLGETSLDTSKGLAQCFEKNNKLAELIGLFCSYSNSSAETYVNNLTSALIASEEHFGITKSLLSPADVIRGTVEEHALTIYLALLRRKVTQLATDNDPSEKSSDINTSAGFPEGLTEEKTAPLPSKIPVSSARLHQPPSSRTEDSAPIPESSSRKRHQEETDEQKQMASSTDKGFKMPSGIPVRKTQKLSTIQPVQTSTPNPKQKQFLERNHQRDGVSDAGEIRQRGHAGGSLKQEAKQQHGQRGMQEVGRDQNSTKQAENRVDLDLSDIEQDNEVNKGQLEEKMVKDVAMGDRTLPIQSTRIRDDRISTEIEKNQTSAEVENKQMPTSATEDNLRLREEQERGFSEQQQREDQEEEGIKEHEKVDVKVNSRICAFVREDGDGARTAERQISGGRTKEDEKKTNKADSSIEKSFTTEDLALLRRGEELSIMIPKGLDLSGSRGDELLSMLEAIGTEGKQLRQELNEAKAREDFLTKKLNERFSSQEEEVINRLVGELEMLRRENQRLFQELATAREAGAEDRKRCENLQAAVERLEMDVERLTAENFRLKFAADTGYQVTGDDLMAAMSDADTGFQSLPSPGKDGHHREIQDNVPSPILEAQSEHETRLLAMKTETESMRKLQELLTKAHAENRRLKAIQQNAESNTNHEVEMAKVKAELGLAQVEGERLREERAQLKKEVEEGRQEIQEQMQKNKELEAIMVRYTRKERESQRNDVRHGEERTESVKETQKDSSSEVLMRSQPSGIQCEQNVTENSMDTFSYQSEALHSFNARGGQSGIATSGNVAKGTSEGILRNKYSISSHDNGHVHKSLGNDFDEDSGKVDAKATVPTDQLVSRAFVVRNDGRESVQELPNSKVSLTLPLTSLDAGSDKTMHIHVDSEYDTQRAGNYPRETPDAVVDWKYLAMSPSPENEMRTIAQYVARPRDLETPSEIESETESRASDLFMSSNVSSPIGRLLSASERRPSLGGMIVARAQTSPEGDSPVYSGDSQVKDDTLIDESYLETSPDYVTADENSVGRTSAINKQTVMYEASDSSKAVLKEDGLTPYYTPMVQRNKLKFSSLSSSLESLRSISRKAREDIDAEHPTTDIVSKKEEPKMEQNVPTLEMERKWIQEELGRIRLDNNIPGEKYPDLARRLSGDKQFESIALSSSRENLQFLPPRNVPRWRKFQFRSRSSRTSETTQQPSSLQSALHSKGAGFRRSPTRTVSLTRLDLSGGTGDELLRTSPTLGLGTPSSYRQKTSPERSYVQRAVSPIRSSSDDMSDEYKPLPDELRKPHVLAERTPVKANKRTVPTQKTNPSPVQSLPPTHSLTNSGNDSERKMTTASPSSKGIHVPLANGSMGGYETCSDPSIQPVLAGNASPPKSRDLPIVGTGTDSKVTSGSLSRVSDPATVIVSTIPQHTKASKLSPHSKVVENPNGREDPFSTQTICDLQKPDLDKHGGSGGIYSPLTPNDLDTLAEKIIQEADSGVSLTSNASIKNGFPTNMYEHRLLSKDEQTYANSLIAKYIEHSQDKV
ncbi:uncharacterized protein LOC121431750 isoform X2 [Lytechinus variegatus]|uniref:uncharacterized protein LOC121431750 isoform X2 n=1 Tax=Lytechinus variegatus TaxID=7654 RepID=UPI001BB0F26D|nr:uncharacterized protein LOC121431750 isoform X2 [Lytechinus variegatus]